MFAAAPRAALLSSCLIFTVVCQVEIDVAKQQRRMMRINSLTVEPNGEISATRMPEKGYQRMMKTVEPDGRILAMSAAEQVTHQADSRASVPTHFVSKGKGGGPSECVADTDSHAVRCCSDTQKEGKWKKKRKCRVWGGSDEGWPCKSAASFKDAEEVCENEGARLCTQREIEEKCTKGTGCSFDNELVWTSTSCTASSRTTHTTEGEEGEEEKESTVGGEGGKDNDGGGEGEEGGSGSGNETNQANVDAEEFFSIKVEKAACGGLKIGHWGLTKVKTPEQCARKCYETYGCRRFSFGKASWLSGCRLSVGYTGVARGWVKGGSKDIVIKDGQCPVWCWENKDNLYELSLYSRVQSNARCENHFEEERAAVTVADCAHECKKDPDCVQFSAGSACGSASGLAQGAAKRPRGRVSTRKGSVSTCKPSDSDSSCESRCVCRISKCGKKGGGKACPEDKQCTTGPQNGCDVYTLR